MRGCTGAARLECCAVQQRTWPETSPTRMGAPVRRSRLQNMKHRPLDWASPGGRAAPKKSTLVSQKGASNSSTTCINQSGSTCVAS